MFEKLFAREQSIIAPRLGVPNISGRMLVSTHHKVLRSCLLGSPPHYLLAGLKD